MMKNVFRYCKRFSLVILICKPPRMFTIDTIFCVGYDGQRHYIEKVEMLVCSLTNQRICKGFSLPVPFSRVQ